MRRVCHFDTPSLFVYVSSIILLQIKIVAAVEVAVADGFHDVVLADLDAAFEVGDGAGYFQDAVK